MNATTTIAPEIWEADVKGRNAHVRHCGVIVCTLPPPTGLTLQRDEWAGFDDARRSERANKIAATPYFHEVCERLVAWNNDVNGGGEELELICELAATALSKAAAK